MSPGRGPQKHGVTPPSATWLNWFHLYLEWYFPRHFHSVRVAHSDRWDAIEAPAIIFLNHASWWDPLAALALANSWRPNQEHYAPMDSVALKQYSFFRRLGLFPVEMDAPRGAAEFLRASRTILEERKQFLWITPQGEFADVRQRPLKFRPGLAAAIRRSGQLSVLPLAIEYCYWEERLPELLMCCGEPVPVGDGNSHSQDDWTNLLQQKLAETQSELASLAGTRSATQFQELIAGGAGTGSVYESWRRWRARMGGTAHVAEHSGLHRNA